MALSSKDWVFVPILVVVGKFLSGNVAVAQALPIGTLAHDGPPTPEQISLVLPVTGSLPSSATATVRFRPTGATNWTGGHPLFRIRPSLSNSPAVGTVADVFAWPILGLSPGTSYQIEVTVTSGATSQIVTGTFTTRALPSAAGSPNKVVNAGASGSTMQSIFNDLNAGDVLEIQDGTYNVDGLYLDRSGTDSSPIYIRGASRTGTILQDSTGRILQIRNVRDVVIENLTLRGPGTDGGTAASSEGIRGGDPYTDPLRLTVRNVTITGVDKGITVYGETSQALVYDNTLIGNNRWVSSFLTSNLTWNDDGINLPGYGNVAFNNSISYFGDSMSYAQHSGNDTLTESRGVHFYRNEIRSSIDDAVEVDHGHRNLSFYDNRIHNAATCSSLDPLYGGPFVYARNVCINPLRVSLHKWNDDNTGQFFYNNTFISTVTIGADADSAGWYQPNNGAQRAYGYRNNLHVYRGQGITLKLESSVHDPIDWTHNSWYPDRQIQWGGVYSNIADAYGQLAAHTPIFSGTSRRMEGDNATTSNPWTSTITLGASSLSELTDSFVPVLAAGTSPKNSGAVIRNVTDGFNGSAPDRGALIEGRTLPTWGDRSVGQSTAYPSPPSNLTVQ